MSGRSSLVLCGLKCALKCNKIEALNADGKPLEEKRGGTNAEYDPLLEGQPVEYIKHVGRYVSSFRNAAYEARSSAANTLEASQTHSRETNVECGAVIKPRCDKGVDKSSSPSGSERPRDDT